MADTRRELILARMKTNLDSITGATVYRSRVELRHAVRCLQSSSSRWMTRRSILTFSTSLISDAFVTTIVRAALPDDSSDTYTQQVHSLLMADQTVNGYALDLTPIAQSSACSKLTFLWA